MGCLGKTLETAMGMRNRFTAACAHPSPLPNSQNKGSLKIEMRPGLSIPFGLAFDATGNLFVGDAAQGTITRFTPDGTRTAFASGLNGPTGMAFDSAGNLYVAQGGFNNATIIKITPSGAKSVFATGMVDPWSL